MRLSRLSESRYRLDEFDAEIRLTESGSWIVEIHGESVGEFEARGAAALALSALVEGLRVGQ